MSGEVREVWGAYHERERLCPEGVRVVEIAHVLRTWAVAYSCFRGRSKTSFLGAEPVRIKWCVRSRDYGGNR